MDTARILAAVRRETGLTQVELARRAGTSQAAVSAYESGRRSPSVATFERLLAACGFRARVELERTATGSSRDGPVGQRLTARKREVREALARHGVRRPRVFGSVARGEDHDGSDLDLLVELPRPSYVLLSQVSADVAEALGGEVDITTESLLRDDVRDRVLEEAVPL